MKETRRLGEQLFSQRLQQLEGIIQAVAAHRRLSIDERGDLYSLVMLKVVQNDYALLRRFRGQSRWGTYLTVIVQRVLLDHRTREWGRWRPSAKARRLGSAGVLLDRCLNRDGLEPTEAIRRLAIGDPGKVAALEHLVEQIPRRPRRLFVTAESCSGQLIDPEAADRPLEAAECRRAAARLNQAFASALQNLPEEERDLINLRFGRGWTVRRIADSRNLAIRPLYRRFERILRGLRRHLECVGLCWRDVAEILDGRDAELEFDLH